MWRIIYIIFLSLIFRQTVAQENTRSYKYDEERSAMIEYQLKRRGIRDSKVLKAFQKVPRHLFVPEKYVDRAYEDNPLPIAEGQTISQPYIVAFMTEVLELSPTDKILEVGTGSGYQAAILAELCKEVYSIEIFESLASAAKELLNEELSYDNVFIKHGDGYKGWPQYAPFDAIIVTCAPTNIPEPLKDQLKEGGRMIIPVGPIFNQKLVLLEKKDGAIKEKSVLRVAFVPMIDEDGDKY